MAEFYSARSWEIPPLPWTNLSPPFSGAPPAKKATETEGNAENKFWTLRRVEAHRFGGLHRHCGLDGEDPEDFVVEVDRDVTLISGFNGAGKTALQNVIIWCLTGRALRSQHMPDEVHAPMDVYPTVVTAFHRSSSSMPSGSIAVSR